MEQCEVDPRWPHFAYTFEPCHSLDLMLRPVLRGMLSQTLARPVADALGQEDTLSWQEMTHMERRQQNDSPADFQHPHPTL